MTRITETRRDDVNVRKKFLRAALLVRNRYTFPSYAAKTYRERIRSCNRYRFGRNAVINFLKEQRRSTIETAGLEMLCMSTRMRGFVVTLVLDDSEMVRSFLGMQQLEHWSGGGTARNLRATLDSGGK